MIDLILLTATMQYENILKILPIIESKQKKFPNINILWVICRDVYNGKGDIEKVIKTLFKSEIQWIMYDSGKEGQKNYGGDMYNTPLFDTLEKRYKNADPWVYILDDDNILTDRMFYALEDTYDKSQKRIIWMHYLRSCGKIERVIPNEGFDMILHNGTLYFRHNPDPSALLFKGSIYKEYGGFSGGGDYDFTSCRRMCMHYYNEIFFDDYYDTRYTTFHNGLRSDKQLNEIEEYLETKNIESYLFIQINNNDGTCFTLDGTSGKYADTSLSVPILKTDTLKKIITIIKEEYKEQYGTKDTNN